MPGINKDIIDEVRRHNDILEVVGRYVQLKRSGGSFKGLSPFQKEKTPSFHVHPQKQFFHDFSSGKGGDVFTFIMEMEGVDFATALRLLADRAGIKLKYEDAGGKRDGVDRDLLYRLLADMAAEYHRLLLEHPAASAARAYLQKRDLDAETVREYQLGFAPEERSFMEEWSRKKKYSPEQLEAAGLIGRAADRPGTYNRFRNRLMFPIRDEIGRTIGFSGRILTADKEVAKYVNSPETAVFKKNRVLYGLDKARKAMSDAREALLCEGQIDVIRTQRAGILNICAPQGTAFTEDHARLLRRYADSITLMFDGDAAGQKATLRTAHIFLAAETSVRIVTLPAGDDPDSLIRRDGAAGLRALLDSAQTVIAFQVASLRKQPDFSREANFRQAAAAVLETIRQSPGAIQRDQMLHQAALALGVPEKALREDLRREPAYRTPLAARAEKKDTVPEEAPPCPDEELAVLEVLANYPDQIPLARECLPAEMIHHPPCRLLLEKIYAIGTDQAALLDALSGNAAAQSLLARVQVASRIASLREIKPEQVLHQAMMSIWQKLLRRRKLELQASLATADAKQRKRLEMQSAQMTVDIPKLRAGWEAARPIIEKYVPEHNAS